MGTLFMLNSRIKAWRSYYIQVERGKRGENDPDWFACLAIPFAGGVAFNTPYGLMKSDNPALRVCAEVPSPPVGTTVWWGK